MQTTTKTIGDALGYNDRLFAGGVRSYLHSARFTWAKQRINDCAPKSILELGCFDGRLLQYVRPERYIGFDAGWEGGIDSAIERFRDVEGYDFHKSTSPEDLGQFPDKSVDVGVSLETLEHIPPDLIDRYLSEMARIISDRVVFSVPNEKGVVFLGKWLVKALLLRDSGGERYRPSELVFATLGLTSKVKRDEHKGFNYADLVKHMERYFDVISVSGVPFGFAPLSFSVGIVAKPKAK